MPKPSPISIGSCVGTLSDGAEFPGTIAFDGSSSFRDAFLHFSSVGSEALNVTIFLRQSLDGSVAPYEHSREFLTHLEQRGLASSHYNMLSFMLQETWVK